MSELVGYILAKVEHMNESMYGVQKAVNRLTKSHRRIMIGSLVCLGLGVIQERRIRDLQNSLCEIRKDVSSIQMKIEEG